MTPDPLSLVGTVVAEKYDVERVVGEGGFAIVYRARHRVWDRPVALKVFRGLGTLAPDRQEELLQAFLREGALLAELSERSSAICQARDVGMLERPEGRVPYMVLEWLDGRSLEEVLEEERAQGSIRPRSPEEAFHFLQPIGQALALAHRKGIAHRDVKPANIFVLGDDTLKLLDFGIAKVVQDVQRSAGAFAQTTGNVSSFTPAYGAPEQFQRSKGATGPWTDVFALALVYVELVTGVAPLRGDDLTQLAFASLDPARRPTPRTAGLDLGDAVEQVLLRALAVEPNDRFAHVLDFWEALRGALGLGRDGTLRLSGDLTSSPALPIPRPSHTPGSGHHGTLLAASHEAPVRASQVAVSPSGPPPGKRSNVAVFAGVGLLALAAIGTLGIVATRKDKGSAATPSSTASAPVLAASTPPPITKEPETKACPAGMVLVPAGKFFMGSDEKTDDDDERPAHQVGLAAFCVDRTEVTVAAYKACSDRGECRRASRENDFPGITKQQHEVYDPLCNIRDPEARAQHPINCVDWELATEYCGAVGKRLPTEAEWEYATRGSDGRRYTWGDDPPTSGEHLNACGSECVAWGKAHGEPLEAMYEADDTFPNTAPVGSFPKGKSPFGVEDVMGNVGEWVSDFYGPYAKGAKAEVSPKGPAKGKKRVVRGGGWNGSDIAWVRPSFRFSAPPTLKSHGIGFRCVKDAADRLDGGT